MASRQSFQASPEVIDSLNKIVDSDANMRSSFPSVGGNLGITTKGTAEGEKFWPMNAVIAITASHSNLTTFANSLSDSC